ncbi:MAG: LLM class flavin-dependent oxidoreductase [Chloroflexi bacterium]|nr:LLM class flavin-dependent oxidoreductase [Chloroflexota bacterium]
MNIGVGLPNTIAGLDGATMLQWITHADKGPFSTAAVLDRVLYDSFDPLATLAAAAAVTERIHLATMIVIAPLRNTAILGKTAATIDSISGGRFTLGVAVGARKDDYDITQSDYHIRGKRLTQQLADLRDHWESAHLGPVTPRTQGPQLLIGGLSTVSFARVARFGDGYMHNGGPPRIFERMADQARSAWRDAGRPGEPQLWGMGYFALGDQAVQDAGTQYLLDYYDFTGPFAERIAAGLLTTPQAITQFIRGYRDAGCDQLILFPTSSDITQLERLADVLG